MRGKVERCLVGLDVSMQSKRSMSAGGEQLWSSGVAGEVKDEEAVTTAAKRGGRGVGFIKNWPSKTLSWAEPMREED